MRMHQRSRGELDLWRADATVHGEKRNVPIERE